MSRGGNTFPEMWSARDGATKPYMDVFTGVFWKGIPTGAPPAEINRLQAQPEGTTKANN